MTEKMRLNPGLSRRCFLKGASAAAICSAVPFIVRAGVLGAPGEISPSDKVRLAVIGAGGMGWHDLNALAPHCDVVALCDVDWLNAAKTFEEHPRAKRYKDFRTMLDELNKEIDGVLVATPDHTHSVAAMAAIQHGKHVYCEKPLAHSIGEVRALMKAAASSPVVTQMGNQGHSSNSIRDFVEWIRSGAIGRVHTIHAGATAVNSGLDKLSSLGLRHAVPSTLDWDLWLGPARQREYHPAYQPKTWRGWTAFGNGTLGDWCCHVLDPVFWALDLGAPATISAETKDYDPKTQGEAFPERDIVTYEFPAKGSRGPVTLRWYSGKERVPRPADLEADENDINTGAAVMGDKGTIVYGSHGAGQVRLVPEKRMLEFKRPAKTIPRVSGHHADWIEAIRNNRRAGSDFAYGGALTEIGLLGTIAIRHPGITLEWDSMNMKFRNFPEAQVLVDPPARKGWEIPV